MKGLAVRKLGVVPYARALEQQRQAARALVERPDAREVLFVLQHPPVITLGRSSSREDVLLDDAELARRGLEVVPTERGGQATVHSPGQVVLYPILHLGQRRLGPARLVELLSCGPARVLGLPGGSLAPGSPADVTLLDPQRRATVDPTQFRSKGRNTPFAGWDLEGWPAMTIVAGRIVWDGSKR